ncbi:WD40 repeat-like protein [Mycena floridula]|nr:WD40 repeat-like protein [Mycena floridula]
MITNRSNNARAGILDLRHPKPEFLWSKKLSKHTSCVNALAVSSKGGRWLASGGDDLLIHLWDFHCEDIVDGGPPVSFTGPLFNIFTLGFSSSNKYLFSAGADEIIQRYHFGRLEEAVTMSDRIGPDACYHEKASVASISCHPFQDEVFLSAGDFGEVTMRDLRSSSGAQISKISLTSEVSSVAYHPLAEHLFVTSDCSGGVLLWDGRVAWGDDPSRGIVQKYNTKIVRNSAMSNPEASSVCFNPDGSEMAVTFLHHKPTIFAVSDPNPIAICSASASGSDPRTYSNSCTMKHGSFGSGFGSSADGIYCTGSDDFRGYIWRIPNVEELKVARREIKACDWPEAGSGDIGYTDGRLNSTRYVPVDISEPVYRLTGHKSIVNTTLIHPTLPHIATAGIERHILLHSLTPSSSCATDLELTSQNTRPLNNLEGLPVLSPGLDVSEIEAGERETILLFDGILTIEGKSDPFKVRRWKPGDDSDSSDSEKEGYVSQDRMDSDSDSDSEWLT